MIDAHHHLWSPDARQYAWLGGGQVWANDEELARLRRPCTLAELAPLAADAGVTGTVVVQTVDDLWETEDLLSLAGGVDPYGASPEGAVPRLVAGVVGWVDVSAPDVREIVARLRSGPGGSSLCGIRHPLLDEPDPHWLTRPEVLRGLRALGDEGLCFDVIGPPHHLRASVAAARAVPGLTFVVNHLGGPPVERGDRAADDLWTETVRQLGGLANTACKLSGMHSPSTDAAGLRPYYDAVLDAFGADRLMFGSDWPVSSLAAAYGDVCRLYRDLTTDLTADERDAVFGRTARRVYGLST